MSLGKGGAAGEDQLRVDKVRADNLPDHLYNIPILFYKAGSMPSSRATSWINFLSGTAFIGNGYIVIADLTADPFIHTD